MSKITQDDILKLCAASGLQRQSLKTNRIYPTGDDVGAVVYNAEYLAATYRSKAAVFKRRADAMEAFALYFGGSDE